MEVRRPWFFLSHSTRLTTVNWMKQMADQFLLQQDLFEHISAEKAINEMLRYALVRDFPSVDLYSTESSFEYLVDRITDNLVHDPWKDAKYYEQVEVRPEERRKNCMKRGGQRFFDHRDRYKAQ